MVQCPLQPLARLSEQDIIVQRHGEVRPHCPQPDSSTASGKAAEALLRKGQDCITHFSYQWKCSQTDRAEDLLLS